jgi:kynurenine 3-monooxygenase
VFFDFKLIRVDLHQNRAYFERQTAPKCSDEQGLLSHEVSFDFMIGADGIHSKTRQQLMRYTRMSYQQVYEDIMWCEFQMPSTSTGQYRLSPKHLHIWSPTASEDGEKPQRLMFVAFPSRDGSFNCSLFAPSGYFSRLSQSTDSLPAFFDRHFPGVPSNLIAPESLQAQFTANPHLPLMDIKCSHLHYGSSVIIVGDAAHAVLPFYGQGLNAGLEDVRILFETLDRHEGAHCSATARATALAAYSEARIHHVHAIYDLSRGNYLELQEGVKSTLYLIRKAFEETMCKYLPSLGWATQYARVSFSNEPYGDIVKSTERQKRIFWGGCMLMVVVYTGWIVFLFSARGVFRSQFWSI